MLAEFSFIFGRVMCPVLTIVGLGALLQRFQALQLQTLVALTIYLLVPCYLFVRLMDSTFPVWEILGMGLAVLLPMLIVSGLALAWTRWRGADGSMMALVIVASVIFNAGNLGIPVAELAHGEAGGRVQVIVMLFVSLITFLVAYPLLFRGQGHSWRKAWRAFWGLPYPYVLLLALGLRLLSVSVPQPIMFSLDCIKEAMVPVALITLGAQMAKSGSWPNWYDVGPVMLLKLIVLPAVAGLCAWALGLWPWPGRQLVLAASAPTAVNALLLTLQVEGNARRAADCVFWTTLGSAVTIPLWLALLRNVEVLH